MKTMALNRQRYGRLLSRALPAVIQTEAENARLLAEVQRLMVRANHLAPEEEALLKLMVALIEDYEDRNYPVKSVTPHDALRELMRAREVRQHDLWKVFGSKGVTSEVVNGKRGISKRQAKALAEFFHVSPALFL